MRAVPHWGEEPQDVWEQTTVYLEKFLFIKLHPIIFGRDANVSAQDDAFFKRLQSLDFLAPEHLDIKSLLLGTDRKSLDEGGLLSEEGGDNKGKVDDGVDDKMAAASQSSSQWDEAFHEPVRHLKLLEAYRTPSDIIAGLRRATVSIASALKAARDGKGEPGADELLPMVILTLVKVKPRKIYSLMAYLNNYTAETKMDSETGYLITHLMSAVQFLGDLDSSGLTIASHEFEGKMALCKQNAQKQIQAKFAWIREERERRQELEEKGKMGTGNKDGIATLSAFSSEEEEEAFVSAITGNEEGDN